MSMLWPIKVVGVLGTNTPSNLSAPPQLKTPKLRVDIAQKLKTLSYACIRYHKEHYIPNIYIFMLEIDQEWFQCFKKTLLPPLYIHVRNVFSSTHMGEYT